MKKRSSLPLPVLSSGPVALSHPSEFQSQDLLNGLLHHHWPLLKAVLKEQYLVLTDDDLLYCEGREDEFLDHLERKTCRPRREFEELILTQGGQFS